MALGVPAGHPRVSASDARRNFDLIDRYPDYIFNFTGANRYAFIQEYFPDLFARLKRYVAAGRWFPGGSNMEESDLDVPSVESLWRQILYGNGFFRRELGAAGEDFMDPDALAFRPHCRVCSRMRA